MWQAACVLFQIPNATNNKPQQDKPAENDNLPRHLPDY